MKQAFSPYVRRMAYLFSAVYFASYTMRINFAVLIVNIGAQMGLEKSALAIVITGLTVAYGGGQVLCGVLGDRIKPQRMIAVGLTVALVCNLCIIFCKSIALMTVVWTINGLAHAMLWPPLVKMLAFYLDDSAYGYAVVRVSSGSSVATICLYALSPLLLTFTDWKGIVLICAAVGGAILALWLIASPRLLAQGPVKLQKKTADAPAKAPERVPLPRTVWAPLVLIMIGIAVQGMLRDGVTNWMPSYLLESFGLGEEKAIFSTVILAALGMLSYHVAALLHRKLFPNEVFCAAMLYLVTLACAVALYVLNLFAANVIVSILLMSVIAAITHGINLMLITVTVKRFVRNGRVSTFSGILNAGTYIGASVSTYGFARIAESFGWNATVLSWALVSLCGLAVCLAAFPLWKKFRKEYADEPQDEK